jgi:hypothetical protein
MSEYSWEAWWGGTVTSPNPPEIVSATKKIRAHVGGLKSVKTPGGAAFPVRSGKELMIKLRAALDEYGYDAPVVDIEGGDVPTDKGTTAFLKATVELRCPDGSFTQFVGAGHGADRDDKAGGKASTYAWKDALTKGLSIPDAEMADTDDESGVSPKRVPAGAKKASGTFDPENASAEFKRYVEAVTAAEKSKVKDVIGEARGILKGAELRAFADIAKPLLGS